MTLDLLEGRGDLLEGQVAALLALRDQLAQLLGLRERAALGLFSLRRCRLLERSRSSDRLQCSLSLSGHASLACDSQRTARKRRRSHRPRSLTSPALSVIVERATRTRSPPTRPTSRPRAPATQVSLSRVGVTGVEKVHPRLRRNGDEQLYHAELECFVDLNPQQAGVHMSRFEEIVNEAIDEVVLGEAFKAETLAAHIAERVRERQGGLRAEVTITRALPGDNADAGQRASRPRRSTRCSAPRSPPSAARAR